MQVGKRVGTMLLLGALFAPLQNAFADTDGSYNLRETSGAWDGTDADRGKAPSADYDYTYGDEANLTHTLPWSFSFYGQPYSQINVDTNGNVWFTATGFANSFNRANSGRRRRGGRTRVSRVTQGDVGGEMVHRGRDEGSLKWELTAVDRRKSQGPLSPCSIKGDKETGLHYYSTRYYSAWHINLRFNR